MNHFQTILVMVLISLFFTGSALAVTPNDQLKQIIKTEMLPSLEIKASAIIPGEIWKEFYNNEVAAMQKYSKQPAVIRGRINRITIGVTGLPQVHFRIAYDRHYEVVCMFDTTASDQVASLALGDIVVLSGYGKNMILDSLFLQHCTLVK